MTDLDLDWQLEELENGRLIPESNGMYNSIYRITFISVDITTIIHIGCSLP